MLAERKDSLPFGVVVTLKEMNGVNRIDDFVKMCLARGWLVQRLDIKISWICMLRRRKRLNLNESQAKGFNL